MRMSSFVRLLILPSLHVSMAITTNVNVMRNTVENSIIFDPINTGATLENAPDELHKPLADFDPILTDAADH